MVSAENDDRRSRSLRRAISASTCSPILRPSAFMPKYAAMSAGSLKRSGFGPQVARTVARLRRRHAQFPAFKGFLIAERLCSKNEQRGLHLDSTVIRVGTPSGLSSAMAVANAGAAAGLAQRGTGSSPARGIERSAGTVFKATKPSTQVDGSPIGMGPSFPVPRTSRVVSACSVRTDRPIIAFYTAPSQRNKQR